MRGDRGGFASIGRWGQGTAVGRLAYLLVFCLMAHPIVVDLEAKGNEGSEVAESDFNNMSLSNLLKQRPELYLDSDTASGVSETIRDTPASMIVVDSRTMIRRGYDSMDDLLTDLPGFDTITANGTMQTIAYQRGYRTPWTQRTLFLVNGKVENNLWNHSAQLSRQYPMSLIDRVETLHGPAGAVYGPNAFLGVINVVTQDSSQLRDGEHQSEASVILGDYGSSGLDMAIGGRSGAFSYDFGVKLYESDEAPISDYSYWGFTDESLLSDPLRWGPGIGSGIDPATGRESPIGDIDVDGLVENEELFEGNQLGRYTDPTTNYGIVGEARLGDWTIGIIKWKTDEGYGPYYSFADGQPGTSWIHESSHIYLSNEAEIFDSLKIESEIALRTSYVGGDWVESFGDNVSLSNWNSYNESWRIEERFTYRFSREFSLSGGIRFEHRDLNKLYGLCNYWNGAGICLEQAENSMDGVSSDGSGVVAVGDISSENSTPLPPRGDKDYVPEFNMWHAQDYGAYVQGIWDVGDWRVNGSLRWDENSNYDAELNPRVAIVRHQNSQVSYKLAYGEAFQEPSPKDLFGGWNGRANNPGLVPEKARNLEFIATCQTRRFMHNASVFVADYRDVIAGGDNVGGREVFGFEYKSSFNFQNFLTDSNDMSGTFYYTYTDTRADMQYNNALGAWEYAEGPTGDIAPHKINFSLNTPVRKYWNVNVAANWVSERELFSQNPLRADSNPNRAENRKAESYIKVNANLLYERERYRIGLKVENLLEEDYLLPGPESASSGDNFSQDFDGFQNSLLPQVNKRVYSLIFTLKI